MHVSFAPFSSFLGRVIAVETIVVDSLSSSVELTVDLSLHLHWKRGFWLPWYLRRQEALITSSAMSFFSMNPTGGIGIVQLKYSTQKTNDSTANPYRGERLII